MDGCCCSSLPMPSRKIMRHHCIWYSKLANTSEMFIFTGWILTIDLDYILTAGCVCVFVAFWRGSWDSCTLPPACEMLLQLVRPRPYLVRQKVHLQDPCNPTKCCISASAQLSTNHIHVCLPLKPHVWLFEPHLTQLSQPSGPNTII